MALVSYVFQKPVGTNAEGDIVQMEAEEAQALIDAGILAEAKAEDLHEEEAPAEEEHEEPAQQAALTRALNNISKNLEKSVADQVAAKVTKTLNQKRNAPAIAVPAEPKKAVYRCMGEMLKDTWLVTKGDARAVNRLNAHAQERTKAVLGAAEGTQSLGGYGVKPEWASQIWEKVKEYPRLIDHTDRISIGSSTFNIPAINETSLADGSRHGGVRGYWLAEGAAATASNPALTQVQAVLQTNVVLSYATLQLLQDANVEPFDKFIAKQAGLELVWQENQAVCSGAGTTQPVGILNQPSLITVTKSSNDGAAMFGFDDLAKMFMRLYSPCRRNAVWLCTPEAYHVLAQMTFVNQAGTVTTYPAFGGISYNAADEKTPMRIFGKPVIEWDGLPQLGNVGDIILADMSQLVTAEHPELHADVSNDIQFTTLQVAFRFYRRYDIRSPWTAALTSYDGNYSFSPFIALQGRGT